MKSFLLVFSLIVFSQNLLFAQAGTKAQVKGKIVDATTNEPLSFASIRISNSADNKLVTGNITNDKGEFSIPTPFGNYVVEIEYADKDNKNDYEKQDWLIISRYICDFLEECDEFGNCGNTQFLF